MNGGRRMPELAYRVAFIGDGALEKERETEKRLSEQVAALLEANETVAFRFTCESDFDILAAACVRRRRMRYGEERASMTLLLPCPVDGMEEYGRYYDFVVCEQETPLLPSESVIEKCRRRLLESADCLIVYAQNLSLRSKGVLQAAERKKIKIVRI